MNPDDWCDYCGEKIAGPPIKVHNRVFCRLACVTAWRVKAIKAGDNTVTEPAADTPA